MYFVHVNSNVNKSPHYRFFVHPSNLALSSPSGTKFVPSIRAARQRAELEVWTIAQARVFAVAVDLDSRHRLVVIALYICIFLQCVQAEHNVIIGGTQQMSKLKDGIRKPQPETTGKGRAWF